MLLRRRIAGTRGDPILGTQAEYALGHLLFTRESVLMAQPFDLDAGRVTGEAAPVADGVLNIPTAGYSAFSASGTGRVAFQAGELQAFACAGRGRRPGCCVRWLGRPGA